MSKPTSEPKGRVDEVERLLGQLGAGRSVLVAGSMGVGKTALLRHLTELLRAQGATVTQIAANAASAKIPFGALSGLIDPAERSAPALQIAAATERLRRLADIGTSVLFIDDAQHLDVASIAAVHRVVTETSTVLMASLRDTDPAPPALRDLWRHADVDRLELHPLADDTTRLIIADALGLDIDDDATASISRRSAGNPLFLGELIRAHRDGVATGLTPHLIDLIGQRIDDLSASEREHLTVVVIGQPLDMALDIVDAHVIEQLELAGLVLTDRDGESIFASPTHPLHGEVIRNRLLPSERRAVSERLGAALLGQPRRRRGDALRVVTWLLDAGDRPPPDLAEAAAFEAIGWLDNALAERLATIAVEDHRTASTLFVLGEVHRLAGRRESATKLWEEAFEIATSEDDIRRVALALGQLYQLFLRRADATSDVLHRALDRISDPAMRIGIESDIAMNEWTGDRRDSVVEIEALLDDPDCGDESAWTALSNLLWVKATALDLDGVDRHLARAADIEERLPPDRDGELDLIHAIVANIAYCQIGPVAAVQSAGVFRQDADRRGIAHGITTFTASQMHQIAGDLDAAVATTHQALAAIEVYDTFNAGPMVCWHGSIAAHHAGDDDLGGALLAEAERRAAGDAPWQNVWAPRAAAWQAIARGDSEAAIAFACTAGNGSIETSEIGWGIFCYHDAVVWGGAEHVVEALARLRPFTTCVPTWDTLFDHAQAASEGNVSGLADVAQRFEANGSRWFAAAAWANRSVLMSAQSGDSTAICRDATRALSLCQGRGLHPATGELALSERQFAVATAAAAGRTSKQVAAALFLSPRTVDNHLREVYRHLGIAGREELSSVFVPC